MKRRIVSLLLVFILVCSFMPISTSAFSMTEFNSLLASFKSSRYADKSTYVDKPSLYGGYECFGFANELATYIFGSYPTNSMSAATVNNGWTVSYGGSAVSSLSVGDIVRYHFHSIFITGIDGDAIYYAQANIPSGTNKVTYDNYISRSALASKVSDKLTSANTNKTGWVAHFNNGLKPNVHSHNYSITEFEAAHPHKEYLKCVCGDWKYTGNTVCVSGCSYCNDSCNCSTSYAGTYTTNNVSTVLRIRDTHSTSGNVIGEIPANAEFSVSKANGTWAHITYNGINGYVSQEYIKKVVPAQAVVVDTRYPTPIKMYTLSSNHYGANAYFTYEDLLAAPSTDGQFVYGDTNGKGDCVTINAVYTSHNVYLNCPWGSSTKDVYSFGGQFFYDMTVTPKKQTAEKTIYTYIRAGSSTKLGYVDPGDLIYILGSQNGYTQIIYPFTADGTYRCGWCLTSDLVHNHSYGAWSNYNSSVHMHSCICGAEETASHTWNSGAITKQPTCSSSGIKTYTCTGCKTTKTEYVAPTTHSWNSGVTTLSPSCTYNGVKTFTCTSCGTTRTESIGQLSHTYNQKNISSEYLKSSATCLSKAVYYYSCICGAKGSNSFEYGNVGSHSYGSWNYSDSEYHVHICKNCGDEKKSVHTWGEPTYMDSLHQNKYVCSGCGVEKYSTIRESIEIATLPNKTVYEIGEIFDPTGLKVRARNVGGSSVLISSGYSLSGFDSSTAGTKTITVEYDGFTTTFNIVVKNNVVTDENAPQIMVDKKTASAGQTVQIKVELKNNPGIAGLAISLKYDESVLTLKNSENGELFSGFTAAKNFAWDESDDVLKDGVLATFTFEVAENAQAGDYSIDVLVRSCTNESLDDVEILATSGKISVSTFMYGDSTGDQKIDMKDVVLLRKYITNFDYDTNSSSVNAELGADANGDNKIDMKDVVILRKYITNYDFDTESSTVVLGPQ